MFYSLLCFFTRWWDDLHFPFGFTYPIQIGQLFKLADDSGNTVALKLVSTNHKHSYNQCPFSIVKHRQPPFCPVQLLLDYLALRSNQPGPLFANLDNTSVSRSFFTDILRLALTSCGLNSSHCKGHSFRIGAASFAKDRGMSDAQIMLCINIFVYLLFQVHSWVHTGITGRQCMRIGKHWTWLARAAGPALSFCLFYGDDGGS